MSDSGACKNTDQEIWRGPDEGGGDFYADSIFITKEGALGIACGGSARVLPIREWHMLAGGPTRNGNAQRPLHASWQDADYNKARDCMIGLLRGRGWTISEGSVGVKEFDNAFQHAVGILALTATFTSTVRHDVEKTGDGASWQPIETAPRDGRRILAFGGGLGEMAEVVSYNERVGCWNSPNDTLDDRDDEADGYSRPTHWMSLPSGPVTDRCEGK